MSQGTLNDYDFAVFGLTINNGMADFLAFPKRKDSVEHDWPEEDGIDKDLADPHFASREFRLTCTLSATSRDDFKAKHFGLYNELKSSGTVELYFADLDETFYVFYKEQEGFKKLSSRINSSNIDVQFDLIFGEINPADNIDDTYIVTDLDEYIIA